MNDYQSFKKRYTSLSSLVNLQYIDEAVLCLYIWQLRRILSLGFVPLYVKRPPLRSHDLMDDTLEIADIEP
jgi:hypothetical protein